MPSISVGLVRKIHGYGADEIESLDILVLNNAGIEEIDNLEVFAQIKELHLSGNKIRVVENLDFLSSLEFLDLSFNRIDAEGLRAALRGLPGGLQTLNLTGNPCAEDESLLMELQDRMPGLGIIVGMEHEQVAPVQQPQTSPVQSPRRSANQRADKDDAGEGEGEGEGEDSGDDDDDEEEGGGEEEDGVDGAGLGKVDDPESQRLAAGPLDADEVLKDIVSRKCRVQNSVSANSVDIDAITAMLGAEADAVFARGKRRPLSAPALPSPRPASAGSNQPDSAAFDWQERAQGIQARSSSEGQSARAFLDKLSAESRARRDERFAKMKGEA